MIRGASFASPRDDVATQFAEERGCNRKDELGACVYDRERGFKASKPTDPSVVVTVASLDASLTPQLLVLTNCKRAAGALEGKLFMGQIYVRELNENVSTVYRKLPQF